MPKRDADGRTLEVGARVATVTGEDRLFDRQRLGTVTAFRDGPPAVGVRFDGDRPGSGLYWFGDIDLMWRCPDLRLIKPDPGEQRKRAEQRVRELEEKAERLARVGVEALQERTAELMEAEDRAEKAEADYQALRNAVQEAFTAHDFERLGGIAGELEHLPPEIRRYFDQDGRDARYLRILQKRLSNLLNEGGEAA